MKVSFSPILMCLWGWTPAECVNKDAACCSAGDRSVARVSTDQGTARIPRELKLPRGSGLCELYPIRAERRRPDNIPIAPLSLPLSPTPSVCSSHSSSPRFISRSLLSALADSNGKTERRVFHSPAWTQNVGRKSEKVGTLADQIAPHRDFICSQEEVKKKKRKRSLNLPSGLDYFCCGCQISGNTFIWHTLISGQIHDIRPCIVRTELRTSVQLSEIQTSAGPRRPKRSLHPFPTVQNRVFLSPLEDTLNYVWLR